MKIAITGATGFVGSRLVQKLNAENHQIIVLTRNLVRAQKIFPGLTFPNVEFVGYTPKESGEWQESISGCDAVINLAGEPIAERWTTQLKQEILESRQLGTRKIVEAIAKAAVKPQVLISGSAIGYYGTSETATFEETSPSGKDFLAEVCQKWEAEATKVEEFGVRLAIIRVGIVLANGGGALAKMISPFKLFAGGPIGTGRQWFSWIHRDDLVNMLVEAVTNEQMSGVYNATSPNPVKMSKFCQQFGEAMNRPSWLPVPEFALELLLGDGAIVVLEGQKVLPKKAQTLGFQFRYPELKSALREIVNNL
ncbi:TIGR01777 family protein [Xenococcus sp. PCC 7305]|uniref:thylakoid membrane protein ThyD n=1 Tax=Xenococcus sp. PCC 7305 TaxID=102125 RepID=UPI0002AC6908|nr:TIGR01777 family oxidoreductase [Xenococcus sp. PCC 7305]ELS04896.1 TIGR01777 family protein [Xenococcus sp. PCC 7305]